MQQVVIIGGGNGGTAILKTLLATANISVLGLSDPNQRAEGIRVARENGIPTSADFREFVRIPEKKLVIDATGVEAVKNTLHEFENEDNIIVGPDVALLIMHIVEEREALNRELASSSSSLVKFIQDGVAQLEVLNTENARTLQEAVSQVNELTEATHNSQALLKETNKILAMIGNLADQTKMLGLNAAIEAARAGEFGRGFSVVADSIRELADDSIKSSNKVSDILKQIDRAVLSTNELVDKVVEDIRSLETSQGQLTQELHATLEEMNDTAEHLHRLANQA